MTRIFTYLLLAVTLITCSSCSESSNVTLYYGIDSSNVIELEKGAKTRLETDLKLTLAMYNGKENVENPLKSDFQKVCSSFNDKVYGIVYLMRSERINSKMELIDATEADHYTFKTPILPAL